MKLPNIDIISIFVKKVILIFFQENPENLSKNHRKYLNGIITIWSKWNVCVISPTAKRHSQDRSVLYSVRQPQMWILHNFTFLKFVGKWMFSCNGLQFCCGYHWRSRYSKKLLYFSFISQLNMVYVLLAMIPHIWNVVHNLNYDDN